LPTLASRRQGQTLSSVGRVSSRIPTRKVQSWRRDAHAKAVSPRRGRHRQRRVARRGGSDPRYRSGGGLHLYDIMAAMFELRRERRSASQCPIISAVDSKAAANARRRRRGSRLNQKYPANRERLVPAGSRSSPMAIARPDRSLPTIPLGPDGDHARSLPRIIRLRLLPTCGSA
jgi:hypothetical protein